MELAASTQLRDVIKGGRAGFFLSFGGQGASWFKELSGYYRDASLRRFIHLAFESIEEELPRVGCSVALPQGLPVRRWLAGEEPLPPWEYLYCAGVSVPMIFLTQLTFIEKLKREGVDISELLAQTVGVTGYSQGLVTACVVGLGLTGSDYLDAVFRYIKYVFYLGIRSQEAFPFTEPSSVERERSGSVNELSVPSPMAAVIGGEQDEIVARVRSVNNRLPADKKIYLCLYNSPAVKVLASHRSSLIKFNECNRDYLQTNQIKYIYVKTTCPFHSPLMEPIRPRIEADIARLGFSYPGHALSVPVYSFYDGRNLQGDEEIVIKLYLDMIINTLNWELAITPAVRSAHVTHLVDFDSSLFTMKLTQNILKNLSCEKSVISAVEPTC